jgi:hypothetical protein
MLAGLSSFCSKTDERQDRLVCACYTRRELLFREGILIKLAHTFGLAAKVRLL